MSTDCAASNQVNIISVSWDIPGLPALLWQIQTPDTVNYNKDPGINQTYCFLCVCVRIEKWVHNLQVRSQIGNYEDLCFLSAAVSLTCLCRCFILAYISQQSEMDYSVSAGKQVRKSSLVAMTPDVDVWVLEASFHITWCPTFKNRLRYFLSSPRRCSV